MHVANEGREYVKQLRDATEKIAELTNTILSLISTSLFYYFEYTIIYLANKYK